MRFICKIFAIVSLCLSPMTSVLVFLINLFLLRNRLNRHFAYSMKNNKYYLHHNPIFLYTWISSKKFEDSRSHAISSFKIKFPSKSLYSKTMTLHDLYKRNQLIGINTDSTFNLISSSYFGILTNVRNIFKLKVFRLFKRIDSVEPLEYKIV